MQGEAQLRKCRLTATEENKVVRSYHTFAFPFIWEKSGLSLEDISDSFIRNVYWCCDDFKDKWELPEQRAASMEERRLLYAEYQYFYPAVRNTLYGIGDHPASHRYTFQPTGRENGYNHDSTMEYIIECKTGDYRLNLNGIRLRLYNTGVGILVFECENTSYTTLADVKAINEYGRRVGVAAVPTFYNAKRLGICIKGMESEFPLTDFRPFHKQSGGKAEKIPPLTYFADFLTDLLNLGNATNRFVSHQTERGGEVFIYPAIDDRMFTHCMVQMEVPCAEELLSYFHDPENADPAVEQSLYELFYVDTQGGCSARETGLRRRELEKSAYLRWLDWSSVYAVTHHSMFMLSTNTPEFLINTFLTEYFELACLCLAQKASLISLQAKMTEISSGLEVDGKRMDSDKVNRLADLQERFVAFSNQFDFYGVTEQYQGVELYDMLREQLYIREARDSLHEQIESLYETANVNQDVSFNKWALVLALIALFWEAASTWTDSVAVFQSFGEGAFLALGVTFAIAAVLVGAAFGIAFGLVHRTAPKGRKKKKG
ncbi:MAG: hypothetical protein LUG65_02230 [Clostridiales bacterium]|nr:hypothetical protein [Clostridiales bacterium]